MSSGVFRWSLLWVAGCSSLASAPPVAAPAARAERALSLSVSWYATDLEPLARALELSMGSTKCTPTPVGSHALRCEAHGSEETGAPLVLRLPDEFGVPSVAVPTTSSFADVEVWLARDGTVPVIDTFVVRADEPAVGLTLVRRWTPAPMASVAYEVRNDTNHRVSGDFVGRLEALPGHQPWTCFACPRYLLTWQTLEPGQTAPSGILPGSRCTPVDERGPQRFVVRLRGEPIPWNPRSAWPARAPKMSIVPVYELADDFTL